LTVESETKKSPEFVPVSVLKDPTARKNSNKRVSFNENPAVIHVVEGTENLDPTSLNGSPEREDPDHLPPLESIPRPIFLTDPSYLESSSSYLEENHSNNFDQFRSKKCPTPPRHLPNSSRSFEPEMSDHENDNLPGLEPAEEAEAPKKSQKPKEPPVTFREFNVSLLLILG